MIHCFSNNKSSFQIPGPVLEPSVHIQGQEPLTASMLAAAPLMDQKQLLGAARVISAVPFQVSGFNFPVCCDAQVSGCTH